MNCPFCLQPMIVEYYYPSTNEVLWKCKECGRVELAEELLPPPFYDSIEAYNEQD